MRRLDLLSNIRGQADVIVPGPGSNVELGGGGCAAARQSELRVDAIGAVRRIDVFNQRDLVASSATLARDNGRVGQEELPNLVKSAWMCVEADKKGRPTP